MGVAVNVDMGINRVRITPVLNVGLSQIINTALTADLRNVRYLNNKDYFVSFTIWCKIH